MLRVLLTITILACVIGLAEAATIRGRVYDEVSKEPVEASIEVVVPGGLGPLRVDSGPPVRYVEGQPVYEREKMHFFVPPNSSDGSFEFTDLAAGTKLIKIYPRSGYAFAFISVDLADDNDTKIVEVPLQRAAALSGTVTDPAGQPLAGARVVLIYTEPEIQRFAFAGGSPGEETKTDETGLFVFEPRIKPGATFRLEASGEDYLPVYSESLTLEPGEYRDRLILQLKKKGFRLSVTVVDAEGQPIEGAPVLVRSKIPPPPELASHFSRQLIQSGFTDANGRIEFVGLAPGQWQVSALDSPRPAPGSRRMIKEIELLPFASEKEAHVILGPE